METTFESFSQKNSGMNHQQSAIGSASTSQMECRGSFAQSVERFYKDWDSRQREGERKEQEREVDRNFPLAQSEEEEVRALLDYLGYQGLAVDERVEPLCILPRFESVEDCSMI